jgi:hypothetical protein
MFPFAVWNFSTASAGLLLFFFFFFSPENRFFFLIQTELACWESKLCNPQVISFNMAAWLRVTLK